MNGLWVRAFFAAALLVAPLAACSTGSSQGPGPAPATAPPFTSTIASAAQLPATVLLPAVGVSIPPVATSGAQPGAVLTTTATTVAIPGGSPISSAVACPAAAPTAIPAPGAPSPQPTFAPTPCPIVLSFQASAAPPATVPGLAGAIEYVLFAANSPFTLNAPPTFSFTLSPFPFTATLRLYTFTPGPTGWADTGVVPLFAASTVAFAPPAGTGPLAVTPNAQAFALVQR